MSGAGFAFTAGEGGLPTAGFALQIGVMAGFNLGAFSKPESALRRFRIYANGMSATTRRDPFDATFLNYGAHLQIQAVKGGKKTDGFRWGGLDVTSGYEYSSYTLTLTEGLPISADPMLWDATGTFQLSAHAQSIPLEVSTNLHIFVVTVFAGIGADYNLSGAADLDVGVDGPLSVTWDGKTEAAGSAGAHLSSSGDAGSWVARGFAGVQADIFFVKLYGQLNVTIDESVGGHAGLRISF